MHIRAFFFKALRNIQYIFIVRKPIFTALDCIDIIIDDKPLFLIAWQLQNGLYVKLNPAKRILRFSEGAAVIKLQPGISSITIIAGNFWTKRREIIPLTHYKLNDATSSELIKQIDPIRSTTTKIPMLQIQNFINVTRKKISVRRNQVKPGRPAAYCPLTISINYKTIQYPTQNPKT